MHKQGSQKLIVIVGETGSGKSALALEIAERYNGALICADSRTIYRGMDIATAKPTSVERARVAHYLLDVVAPDEAFSVADFQKFARDAIADISTQGKLPIMVGGTGLYIDSILYDFTFTHPVDVAERARIELLSIDDLQAEAAARGLKLPVNSQNPRHLQRLLETGGVSQQRSELRPQTLILGLRPERAILRQRIIDRVDAMFEAGVVAEAADLLARYGSHCEALKTPGYIAIKELLDGSVSEADTKAQFVQSDMRLARRQRTWFRRNNSIHWLDDPSNYVEFVTTFLADSA